VGRLRDVLSINAKAYTQNTNYPQNPMILANFYDLVDSNAGGTGFPLPQKCHFGLVYDRLAQKLLMQRSGGRGLTSATESG